MRLPQACGPVSGFVRAVLQRTPPIRRLADVAERIDSSDLTNDQDVQVALFMLYEGHYRGFDEVDASMEWNPELIALRSEIERQYLSQLRRDVVVPDRDETQSFEDYLFALPENSGGPTLSEFLARTATLDQFKEFVIHRSAYHLKEADPYTWAIPRLTGRAKAGLVEIQADEYGGGRPNRMHSELFRQLMRELDLDDTYGRYIGRLPAMTLAAANLSSMFGLNRELRGAAVGHFAALEMTSSLPNRRYGNGLRRLGFPPAATLFFDEHVEADAVHEQLVVRQVCAPLARENDHEESNVIFGVLAYLHMEALFAAELLDRWAANESSLRQPPIPDTELRLAIGALH